MSCRQLRLFRYCADLLFVVLITCAPSWAADKTPSPAKVNEIVIVKSAHRMTLLRGGQIVKTYRVALGGEPVGPKTREGDGKTPEGKYVIAANIAKSRFHRALLISYPNAADRERARKLGVNPGGAVEIHGLEAKFAWLGALHRQADWTAGCIAVTNVEIDEIWDMVDVSTPVEIRP